MSLTLSLYLSISGKEGRYGLVQIQIQRDNGGWTEHLNYAVLLSGTMAHHNYHHQTEILCIIALNRILLSSLAFRKPHRH